MEVLLNCWVILGFIFNLCNVLIIALEHGQVRRWNIVVGVLCLPWAMIALGMYLGIREAEPAIGRFIKKIDLNKVERKL